jgi:maleylacetoacetate isomerase
VNLEYSLGRELLRSNRAGSYANSTIINCNTRKYHGMLITPQPGIDHENHVLLSSWDETVIQMDASFNLGMHRYPGGKYSPKGHKYLRNFSAEPYPKMTYRVGGVILTKEMVFTSKDDRMIIKYTLVEANSPTKLRFKPFLAFRNIHQLSKENIFADKKYEKVAQGIKVRMYQGYTDLFLQFSKDVEYTHVPDWYYNIEYLEEIHPNPPLLPISPIDRAWVRSLAMDIAADIHPISNLRVLRYLVKKLEISVKDKDAWYQHWIALGLESLEKQLCSEPRVGNFAFGNQPGLIDICLVPQIFNACSAQMDVRPYPTLMRIFHECMKLPAFIDAAWEKQIDAQGLNPLTPPQE